MTYRCQADLDSLPSHPEIGQTQAERRLHCQVLRPEPADERRLLFPHHLATEVDENLWDVDPHWVEENTHAVTVLDVREPAEWDGPLGRIPSAVLIPLGQLAERTSELSKDKPIVAVCRAGGPSSRPVGCGRPASLLDLFAGLSSR